MVEKTRTKQKCSSSVLIQSPMNIILPVLGQKAKGFPCLFLLLLYSYSIALFLLGYVLFQKNKQMNQREKYTLAEF